jgi:hypothetical protein
MRRSALNGG